MKDALENLRNEYTEKYKNFTEYNLKPDFEEMLESG
jgi:hypothetical protein